MQLVEGVTRQELADGAEEVFLANLDDISLSRYNLANADELGHTALHAQFVHLTEQLVRLLTALVNIAQYQRPLAASSVHKVEGNV